MKQCVDFCLQNKVGNWKLVFLIAAAVYFVDNLIFIVFAKGEVQKWNGSKKDEKNMKMARANGIDV